MREKLKEIENVRELFTGEFKRYGWKNGYRYPMKTVLLINIKDETGTIITDHLWFNFTKGFEKLGELKEGEIIKFKARSKKYTKGYKGHKEYLDKSNKEDYKLSNPTIIEKI